VSRTYRYVVGVALSRPPKIDEYRGYVVVADTDAEARTVALQMASCTSVMPVWLAPVYDHMVGMVQLT
jgi:hypothetical protein